MEKDNLNIPPHSFDFFKEDNGKKILINKGDEVIIHLKTNPTTGYDWLTHDLETVFLEETRDYQTISEALGSSSQLQIHYRAISKGVTFICLHYCRSWEKNIPPLDTFNLDVNIEA
jgi:inhibitor of cysteine peptidase